MVVELTEYERIVDWLLVHTPDNSFNAQLQAGAILTACERHPAITHQVLKLTKQTDSVEHLCQLTSSVFYQHTTQQTT